MWLQGHPLQAPQQAPARLPAQGLGRQRRRWLALVRWVRPLQARRLQGRSRARQPVPRRKHRPLQALQQAPQLLAARPRVRLQVHSRRPAQARPPGAHAPHLAVGSQGCFRAVSFGGHIDKVWCLASSPVLPGVMLPV